MREQEAIRQLSLELEDDKTQFFFAFGKGTLIGTRTFCGICIKAVDSDWASCCEVIESLGHPAPLTKKQL